MSRQDQIVDDDEPETCPLCIEELDLSDRRFRPCPCGFQICQFCYNHVKTQMNSLCPACRRPYDDQNIKFEAPSAEEVAKYKESKAQQDKKKAAARRQEAASRHADNLSRKHLAGIRVRRHNLVYVTGLRLNTSDPLLSEKLRGDQFFGQYGKIDKIVVNKPKDSRSVQPVGVYITYFEKEAAALCIEMVNGSQNAGSLIRADYGTTKYCSAFLRGENCSNKNCTFLHEVGDDNESFTREGLSSLNAISSQFHGQTSLTAPQTHHHSNQPQQQSSPQQQQQQQQQQQNSQQPAPSTTPVPQQSTESQETNHEEGSPGDSSDGSALPSTASWAKEPSSRRASQAQSMNSVSPAVSSANPMPPVSESPVQEESADQDISIDDTAQSIDEEEPSPPQPTKQAPPVDLDILRLTEALKKDEPLFVFDDSSVNPQELELIKNMPPLFDPYGGLRRLAARRRGAERESERARREKDNQVASQALSAMDAEDNPVGGSLQLGGEPEDRQDLEPQPQHPQPQQQQQQQQQQHQQQRAIRPPSHDALRSPQFGLEHALSPTSSQPASLGGRSPMPQQQQQQQQQQSLLEQFKSASPNLLGPGQRPLGDPLQSSAGVAHARQASRFSFANDSASATTSIKPVTNTKLMNQQSSMMPANHGQFSSTQQQGQGNQFFTSSIQGPPPGLKATGTPPVSGGGMFGQGHGFATAGLGYGMNSASRNSNDEMMRELLRTRGSSAGSGQTPDGGRRGVVDLADPSILQARMHQSGAMGQGQYGAQSQGQDLIVPDAHPFGMARAEHQQLGGFLPSHPSGLSMAPTQTQPSATQLFGRGLHPTHEETALMPGLGVLPRPASRVNVPSENARPTRLDTTQAAKTSTKKSVAEKAGTSSPRISDESFPALPKPSTPKSTAEQKPKPFRQAAEEQNRSKRKDANTATADSPAAITADQSSRPKQSSQQQQATQQTNQIERPSETKQIPTNPSASGKPAISLHATQDRSSTPSTNSRPTTPTQSSDAAATARRSTQPRNLRVIPGDKIDSPLPALQVGKASAPSSHGATDGTTAETSKEPSRQPSIASLHRSATPASERFTDNMSATSGSVSRASSPVQASQLESTAPTKPKTKSQLKKEKNERVKPNPEEKKETTVHSEAVVQEPIVGRKKKAKKPTTAALPTTSHLETSQSSLVETETQPPETAVKLKESTREATPEVPEVPVEKVLEEAEPSADPKPANVEPYFSTQSIMQEIADGSVDVSNSSLFNGPTSMSNLRYDFSMEDARNLQDFQPPLTASELETLTAGEPIYRGQAKGNGSCRIMITPGGKCLFGLREEMEERYLELERKTLATPMHCKYVHKRTDATRDLTSADEMSKDIYSSFTRPPTTVDAVRANAQQALGKAKGMFLDTLNATNDGANASLTAYGDDALQYMNKFILPPIPDRSGVVSYPSVWNSVIGRGPSGVSMYADGMFSITGAEEDLNPPLKGRAYPNERERAGGGNIDALKQAWLDAVDESDDRPGRQVDGQGAGTINEGAIELDAMEKAIRALKRENEALDKKMLALTKRSRRFVEMKQTATEVQS